VTPGVICPAADDEGRVRASTIRLQSMNVRGTRQRITATVRSGSAAATRRAISSAVSGAPTSVLTKK
jgi:hypothetical protein